MITPLFIKKIYLILFDFDSTQILSINHNSEMTRNIYSIKIILNI